MKRYAHYYLQSRPATDRGGHWETVEQARAYSVLKSGLAREIANDRGAEIRLVGAYHDDASGDWQYAQLFYLDQSSINLPMAEDQPPSGFDDDAVDGYGEESEPEDHYEERTEAPRRDESVSMSYESPPESEDEEPWPSDRGEASERPAYDDLPPVFRKPVPRKKRSAFRTIILLLLVLLLVGGGAVSVMLYLQHPAMLSLADKVGLGSYARMFPHASMANEESMMDSQTAEEPTVMPLTTGNVIRYRGIAPTLVGRWSPDNCGQNYVIFTDTGYTVTREGKTSPETVEITETLEDDFQFYLRRSPTLVEHLQKLGPNDIQMAGSTGTGGFMASGNTIQILNRCPRE
ncbi:hypothetical protein [Nisaea nitritireducens]|uniref:hypothetical protein n=1 Tax=Nisaea nitritireducens TaxID=568392 RepID=UPI0018675F5F|nr:hypothetical protein [Nisaea nitritireducens]